jgi:hypothetical protein
LSIERFALLTDAVIKIILFQWWWVVVECVVVLVRLFVGDEVSEVGLVVNVEDRDGVL